MKNDVIEDPLLIQKPHQYLHHFPRQAQNTTTYIDRNETKSSTSSFIHTRPSKAPKCDITSTPLYKEIYANNIRHYSYIVAKQLGSGNHSPQQLRKMYLQHQQKATVRNAEHMTSHIKNMTSYRHSHEFTDTVTSKKEATNPLVKDDNDVDYRSTPAHADGKLSMGAAVPLAYRSCRKFEEQRKKKGSMCEISQMNGHKILLETLSNTTYSCKQSELNQTKFKPLKSCSEGGKIVHNVGCCQKRMADLSEKVVTTQRQNEAEERQRQRLARLNSLDTMVSNLDLFMKKNTVQATPWPTQSLPHSAKLNGIHEMNGDTQTIEGEWTV